MNRPVLQNQRSKLPVKPVRKEPSVPKSSSTGTKYISPLVGAIMVFALAIGLYINTLGHDYTLDDTMMITKNAYTLEGFGGLGKIMTNDAFTGFHGEDKNLLPGGRYRPVSQIMFAIEYGLFGLNPFPGHLINVLLYALACLLMLKALTLLFADVEISLGLLPFPLIIALLFTAHPLHTEVVANIKGRDEILGLIGFALLAIMALRFARDQRPVWLFAMVPVFILSILSKESALTYLAAVPLLVLFRMKRPSREMWQVLLTLGAGLVAYVVIRVAAVGTPPADTEVKELLNNPWLEASSAEKLATLFYTWIRYIALILFPHPLTFDYYPWHITYKSLGHGAVLVSLVFFTGLGIYSLKKLRKPNLPALGFMLFVILFSSQSNLLVNIGSFMNERFVFVALVGILIMLGWLLFEWLPGKMAGGNRIALSLFVLMMIGFSAKTVIRNRVWKDDFTLFTHDVNISKNSAKGNIMAGGTLFDRGLEQDREENKVSLIRQAVPYLQRGVELYPGYIDGHLMLGNALLYLDDYAGALHAYQNCIRINARYEKAFTNLRMLALRARKNNDYNNAAQIGRVILQYRPQDFEVSAGLAEDLMMSGSPGDALSLLDSLVLVDPAHAQVHHLLGQAWGRYLAFAPETPVAQRGAYLLKALGYLQKAAALDTTSASITENLAIVYGLLGQTDRALPLFLKALQMLEASEAGYVKDASTRRIFNTDLARLLTNIADTYRNAGNPAKAREFAERARELAN